MSTQGGCARGCGSSGAGSACYRQAQEGLLAEGRICYAFAHRIRPLCAAAQHQQERARGRRKRPGFIAGMQAAGSEAERRQAGLTERKVRVALLT